MRSATNNTNNIGRMACDDLGGSQRERPAFFLEIRHD